MFQKALLTKVKLLAFISLASMRQFHCHLAYMYLEGLL